MIMMMIMMIIFIHKKNTLQIMVTYVMRIFSLAIPWHSIGTRN